jgi:D-alanyl-D-alanine carboxypeptidase (penicillin-binding protein 5/6)
MAPRVDITDTYTADWDDANQEGTRIGLWPGHTYRVEDLWYGLMLRSGNDAAFGLAKAGAGGDLAKGVQMMNDEAKRLQAYDTTVVTPSGLDEDGQYSSAYDLALWGRAGLQRNDFSEIVKTVKWQFPGNRTPTATKATAKDFWVYTENRLLLQGYEGAIGVKMGYTTKAQNTMIAAAERDGHKILVSLMGVGFGGITPGAKALLEWGFDHVGKVAPVGRLVDPVSPAVTGYGTEVNRPEPSAADRDIDPATVAKLATKSEDSSGLLPASLSGKSALPWAGAAALVLGALATAILTLRVLAVRKRRRQYWIDEVRRRNALAAQMRDGQARAEAGSDADSGLASASE